MRAPDITTKITVEVGPISFWAGGRREGVAFARELKNDIDDLVRAHMRVGKRSKTVQTRAEEVA